MDIHSSLNSTFLAHCQELANHSSILLELLSWKRERKRKIWKIRTYVYVMSHFLHISISIAKFKITNIFIVNYRHFSSIYTNREPFI